jgi:hypothetical protein
MIREKDKEKLTKLPHGGVAVREYISHAIIGH